MSLYLVPPFIGSLAFLALTLFIFNSKPHTKPKTLFTILCLETFCWQVLWLSSFYVSNPVYISAIAKMAYVPITFLPFTFFHFIASFLKSQRQKTVIFFYAVGFFFVATLPTNLYVSGHRVFEWGKFAAAGVLYPVFVVMAIASLSLGVSILLDAVRKPTKYNVEVNQCRYLLLGMFFYALCASDFPQVFGLSLYPVGSLFFLISFSIITYAITKHKILDIEVVIRRTAVFAGLFAFVYGVFTIFTILGQDFFHSMLGLNTWISTIPTVFIITFALRPLERFLTDSTEKFLFQKKYDYRVLLKTFTNEVLTVLDLQKLTEQTISGLMKIMKLESACILLLDKDLRAYKVMASSGVKSKDVIFKDTDTVVSYLKETEQHILKDKNTDQMDGHSHLRDDFKKLSAQLCLPISHHDELIGILGLGLKKSGEEFTQEDLDILTTLSRTLGIAIANAQLFDQLSKTQAEAAQREKMAVIGTLAAGINHEICNPLGIVRGQCEMFLLNLRDGLYSTKNKEDMCEIATDIMNKVIKETDRATGITKKLSGFAKPAKKVESEEVFVEKEADEVMGLIGHDLKLNNIKFSKNFSRDFPTIFADKRQIQEVLFNIIRNAAQAMDKKDGKIELSGVSTTTSAIIKIADNGSGIPTDKIGQIFNPFFTTKEPGKGTGLGLFIVKQVVERNKGTIVVDSVEGSGTTFTLTFPLALAAKAVAA